MTNAELQEWVNKAADALFNTTGERTEAVAARLLKDMPQEEVDEIRDYVKAQRKNYAKPKAAESKTETKTEAKPDAKKDKE